MYALSFYSDDIPFIVSEALKAIPGQSQFYQCIDDVIGWYYEFPDDWKRTWFEAEKKWSSDIGCPDGVFKPFNIDAKINAAYIVIGMLYGEGDFGKTVDISTRCGQDSDCNPASAGGILGAILGYDAIPDYWKQGLDQVEDMDFKYTTISLNDTYDMSYRHALEMIRRNGGEELDDAVRIIADEPVPVQFEKAFEGHFPVKRIQVPWGSNRLLAEGPTEYSFTFEGTGFAVTGGAWKLPDIEEDLDLEVEIYIDGELDEEVIMPTRYQVRRNDVAWKYNLENGPHDVRIVWKNPSDKHKIDVNEVIVYGPDS
jgi:hypothetical protein